jgi:hypothetical protein
MPNQRASTDLTRTSSNPTTSVGSRTLGLLGSDHVAG